VRREFEHYLSVWSDAISNSHSHTTPWYVIPADSKWYRDHIVMETVVDALRKLHQEYPGLAEPISEADVVD
jgi:polyphosphate kinase 2 (PPK2 family)